MAPGTCASSNCWSVRTSTRSAPAARRCSTWRGASGKSSTPVVSSGPVFSATTSSKCGGWGPSPASAAATKRSSSRIASVGLCAASKPIVEDDLRSMPGPPHIEPPRCAGQTSTAGAAEELLVQRAEDRPRAPGAPPRGRAGRRRRRRGCRPSGRPTGPRRGACRRARRRCARAGARECARPGSRATRGRARRRRRAARGRRPAPPSGARGSWRPSPLPAGRGPRRGRHGCASRGRARCRRRGSGRARGARRPRSPGRPRRPRRPPRRPPGRRRRPGRRG